MKEPEYHKNEEFINRSEKLKELCAVGVDPYPHTFAVSSTLHQLSAHWEGQEVGHSEDAAEGKTQGVCAAGRLVLFRAMGKNAFAHLQDETGRIQVMFNRDATALDGYEPTAEISALKFIEKKIDLGDFLGVEGNLFRTQKGELTIFVRRVVLLCKALLPLPDKHSGLADKGVRYRKRWLDLIANPEVVHLFQMRSLIFKLIRRYFEELNFMEVETPVLQNVYGGAQAKPFITKLNALDQEMFLRISLEIPLKKLLVGGLLKVFEIGKVFRNEGLDRTHNPEFTELEAYAAYWDYNDMMALTEKLFEKIAIELFGTTVLAFKSQEAEVFIDLKTPWKRLSMKESIQVYGHLDIDHLTEEQMRKILLDKGSLDPKEIASATRGSLIAFLFEEFVEEHLIQPHHIIDHPIETTPLCKPHRDPTLRSEGFVERFETFILGNEYCNSYTELNDPVLQRKLLVDQAEKRFGGDEEASPLDEEFIEAVEQGMPLAAGLGIGLDRLVMLFTKAHSIRDVLFFPIMRPEE